MFSKQLRQHIEARSDEELLDIVEGRDLGYREEAVVLAQETLRSRRVGFTMIAPSALTAATEEASAVKDAMEELWRRRRAATRIAVIGGALITVPIVVGGQFDGALAAIGVALVVWGLGQRRRVRSDISSFGEAFEEFLRTRPEHGVREAFALLWVAIVGILLVAGLSALFL